MINKFENISGALNTPLEKAIEDLMAKIAKGEGYFRLPTNIDTIQEANRQVALSSNAFTEATRVAGMARSAFKIAEAKYKYKFRTNLGTGKNASEREAKAMDAAQAEYEQMVYLSSVVELAESIEVSCRVASESARKVADTAKQLMFAENRFNGAAGALGDKDYQSF